jgi:glucosamine--fructose-6-phosphate aminotransferase (isomerizing)
MCGIVAYIGHKDAYPILIKGLQRLEYRGYDSAGVALLNDKINMYKTKGKVSELVNYAISKDTGGNVGIAHTRWATHGEPNTTNAHPHFSQSEDIAIIHNGIIENYDTIRDFLVQKGYTFRSETDTEVLVQLIEDIKKETGLSLFESVRVALNRVVGAYAIAVVSVSDPDKIVVARKGSPLVVGIGKDGDFYVASDAAPIVEYTKSVYYLDDEDIACLRANEELHLKTIKDEIKSPKIEELDLNIDALEKAGFDHFMLKEIHEQPTSILDSMRGRISAKDNTVKLGGIEDYEKHILDAHRIIMVACGTSWHAGIVGEYLFEELARIPVEVEYGSEFRYRNPIITNDDVVIAISQSGETADTLAAIDLAKQKGALLLGVCNVVGSSIARATHAGVYTHAGPEIGVASTKAFTAQVTVLTLMALRLGFLKKTIDEATYHSLINELEDIPAKVEEVLKTEKLVKEISAKFKNASNFLYLGRGINFPVALEGALKLKEISYIHAEGYPAAEMKHGPIALIDENMPIVVIATKEGNYEKIVSNIQEIKARKGIVIAIVTKGDTTVAQMADYVVEIPKTEELLVPLLATIPLQLLSYHIAVMRGCNVDMPRNLAKSVTVE